MIFKNRERLFSNENIFFATFFWVVYELLVKINNYLLRKAALLNGIMRLHAMTDQIGFDRCNPILTVQDRCKSQRF